MIVLINTNSRLVPLLHAQELKLVYDFTSISAIAVIFAIQTHYRLDLIEFVQILTASQLVTYSIYWLLLNHAVNRTVMRHAGRSPRTVPRCRPELASRAIGRASCRERVCQ